jgi:hypothetical protein
MKPLLCLLALSATALLTRAEEYSFKEPFTRTAPFNATGELSVDNVNGQVEVGTWDKNEILIEGEKSAKTEEELKLIELTIETSPTAATIKTRLPKRSGSWFKGNTIRAAIHLKITVPSQAVVEHLSTVNGSVVLENLAGRVHTDTVNGRITATALRGDAKLATVNGSIHADFASLAAAQHLSFDSVNGSITVALPSDAGAEIRASVVNGHVDCDFPITLSSGRVSHSSIKGTIGDGRATLKADSVNGSIHLKQWRVASAK